MDQVPTSQLKRIGFIATRISGNDGVSLEIGKWAEVLQRLGHTCYYIAGQSDRPDDKSRDSTLCFPPKGDWRLLLLT